jgi:hypothetical protein
LEGRCGSPTPSLPYVYPPQVAEIGCCVVMMATLLIALLNSSGAYGPYSLPWCVYESVLTGCLEAWSTYTTLVLALFMQERSRLRFRKLARSSSFWLRNRWALWALTVACVIFPLSLVTLNVLVSLLTETVSSTSASQLNKHHAFTTATDSHSAPGNPNASTLGRIVRAG